jgi:hypothetical protein
MDIFKTRITLKLLIQTFCDLATPTLVRSEAIKSMEADVAQANGSERYEKRDP